MESRRWTAALKLALALVGLVVMYRECTGSRPPVATQYAREAAAMDNREVEDLLHRAGELEAELNMLREDGRDLRTLAGLDPEASGEDIVEEIVRRRARDTHLVAEVETRMQLGETYEARLIASRSGKAVVDLSRRTPEPTVIEEQTPIVSEASAGLTSARFDITRTSPEWQSFAPGAPTVWTWTVKPKTAGRATLTFHLYQRLGAGPESATIPVRSFPKDVEIQVSLWRRAYNGVRAVFTSVGGLLAILASIVAVLAFYIEHVRKKKAIASGASAAPAPFPPPPPPAPPPPASPAKSRKSGRSKPPKEEESPPAS